MEIHDLNELLKQRLNRIKYMKKLLKQKEEQFEDKFWELLQKQGKVFSA